MVWAGCAARETGLSHYALDSNVIIHYLRGEGRVAKRMLGESPERIWIPTVVAYEVEVGVLGSRFGARRRREWEEFVQGFRLLPFDAASARRAAQVGHELGTKGERIGPLDIMIAGCVLAHGLTLVTHNRRKFSRVAGLKIEDWY